MHKRERNLFVSIAGYAIDKGCKVSLESKNNVYDGSALNGVLTSTKSIDRGLILRIKPSKEGIECAGNQ